MKYVVEITETLTRLVTVEANSAGEAANIVEDAYNSEEIILGPEDYVGAGFITVEQIDS
jgi:hypothetical protein